jgi:competence protein ComGC
MELRYTDGNHLPKCSDRRNQQVIGKNQSKTVMKLGSLNRHTNALTLTEVLVVLVVVAVLIAVLLPSFMPHKRRVSKIGCVQYLQGITLAFRIWEGDNGDKYPTQLGSADGGVMELAATGNVAVVFQVMSNELSTARLLICPTDARRHWATNFPSDFGNTNVSYFVGLDAAEKYPNSILIGDDNWAIKRVPIQSAVVTLSKDTPLTWTGERHRFTGNIGLADGSVWTTTDSSLTDNIINQYKSSSDFTNRFRFAIP